MLARKGKVILSFLTAASLAGFFQKAHAAESFYDAFLSNAIAQCPGFIGGDSQLKINITYSSYGEGRHRYESECIPGAAFRNKGKVTILEASKQIGGPVGPDDPDKGDQQCHGSIILPTSGAVGERIPLVGTGFDLYYFTDRTTGKSGRNKIRIPLHDTNSNVTGYKLYSEYAGGRVLDLTFSNVPDQVYDFEWDGMDSNSDFVIGSTRFDFTVSILTHGKEVPMTYKNVVGGFKAEALGFGLWTPSIYHFYDVVRGQLVRGDGTNENLAARTLSNGDLMVAEPNASVFYIFDPDGKHLFTKFGLTGANKYTFNYDMSGRLSSITDAYGQETHFTLVSGKVTEITTPKGQVTQLQYNGSGFLSQVKNPKNETYKIEYLANGLMNKFMKPEGQINSFYYDDQGRLTKDYHSSGYFQDLIYVPPPPWGLPQVILKSAKGIEQKFTIQNTLQRHNSYTLKTTNSLGYQSQKRTLGNSETTTADNVTLSMAFSPDKRFSQSAKFKSMTSLMIGGRGTPGYRTQSVSLSDSADPFSINTLQFTNRKLDKVSTETYNGTLRQWTYVSAEGRNTKIKLNDVEDPVEMQFGNQLPMQTEYNSDGTVKKMSQGDRMTSFAYSNKGFLSELTNALGQKTTFVRDENGRVLQSIKDNGDQVKYEYDKNGNLIGITPPSKPKHSFILNAFEAVREYLPPALGGNPLKTEYKYNADKQVSLIRRPDNQTIGYVYDSTSGLLSTIWAPQGTYNFTYNSSANNIATATSPDGVATQYTYVGPLRTQESQEISSSLAGVRWKYDAEQRVQSLEIFASSNRSNVNRVYDKDDLLIRNGLVKYERLNAKGLITKMSLGNAVVQQSYDSQYGDLNKIEYFQNNISKLSREYQRDRLGRISYERGSALGSYIIYDRSGRYIGRQPFGGSKLSHEYKYDQNGNRVSSNTPDGKVTATYDDQDRLLTWGDYEYAYNENGERITKSKSSLSQYTYYQYDAFGNLRQVDLPSGNTVSYQLDASNRRVVRKVNGVRTNRFIYEDQLRISAELDGSDQILKRYVYGNNINVPDSMEYNGRRYLFIKDIRGSVLRVVDSESGTLAQELVYDDWGKVVVDTNPGFQPFGFAGGLYDGETGLVHFGAREYDPEVGRWTSKDPILFKGGDTNLFVYVFQDPINYVDPRGTDVDVIEILPLIPIAIVSPGAALVIGMCAMVIPSDSPKSSDRDCGAERWAGWKNCDDQFREVHDGSQGRCYDQISDAYNACVKSGGKP